MGLKINDLADLNLRELTEKECKSLQGGLSWDEGFYKGRRDRPYYPGIYNPQPKPEKEPVINNVECTNNPFHGGSLPWCAVVL